MSHHSSAFAFFDFDGTVIDKDSYIEFLKYYGGNTKYLTCLFVNSPFIVLFLLKSYPNYKLKERFFSFYFKGKSESEIKKIGDEFGTKVLPGYILESAKQVIIWHQKKGHEVYLLTASSDLWLGKWCENMGIAFIGTKFETQNGKFTGKIDGNNCYGPEKLNRIKHLLKKDIKTYGYGDSTADQFYLDKMDVGYKLTLNDNGLKGNGDLQDQIST